MPAEEMTAIASTTGLAEVAAQIERLTRDANRTEAEQKRLVTVDGSEYLIDTVNGRPYDVDHAVAKACRERPTTVHLTTLGGLAEMVASDPNGQELLVWTAPDQVVLQSPRDPKWLDRDTLAVAALPYVPLLFGEWYGLDEFRIAVLGLVENSAHREALLKALAMVAHKEVTTVRDDGTGQSIAFSAGKDQGEAWQQLPSELELAPRRTFPEVEQPASTFILRVKTSREAEPEARLIETDGGLWRIAAVKAIKAHLVATLESRGLVDADMPTFVA